jgi:hypothetical protein
MEGGIVLAVREDIKHVEEDRVSVISGAGIARFGSREPGRRHERIAGSIRPCLYCCANDDAAGSDG